MTRIKIREEAGSSYSRDPDDWEIMHESTGKDLGRLGIERGTKLTRIIGGSVEIKEIEYYPPYHCTYLMTTDGQDLPAGTVIRLINQGKIKVEN